MCLTHLNPTISDQSLDMASGSIREQFGICPRPSSRRIRLSESIREYSGLSPMDLLSTIITTARHNSKLKNVLMGHVMHHDNPHAWTVRLLEELAKLVQCTGDNLQLIEMFLAWAVNQRGNAFELTHEDVRVACNRYHFMQGFKGRDIEKWDYMLQNVNPPTYTAAWEMEHDSRPLPQLTREEEDAEESEDDGETLKSRRVNQFLTASIATSQQGKAGTAAAVSVPTPSTPPSSAPSTPPYAPATAPSAPTRKRGRSSDDNESETNSNGQEHGKDRESAKKRRHVG